jgi:hypothetical protein
MIICDIIYNITHNILIMHCIITNHCESHHCKCIIKIQKITHALCNSLTTFSIFQAYLFSLLYTLYYISLKICKKLVVLTSSKHHPLPTYSLLISLTFLYFFTLFSSLILIMHTRHIYNFYISLSLILIMHTRHIYNFYIIWIQQESKH